MLGEDASTSVPLSTTPGPPRLLRRLPSLNATVMSHAPRDIFRELDERHLSLFHVRAVVVAGAGFFTDA